MAVRSSGRQRELPRFCFEYFLTAYGLRTLAQQHLYTMLYSIGKYRGTVTHTRFLCFLRFLGMSNPCVCASTPGGKCVCDSEPPLDVSLQVCSPSPPAPLRPIPGRLSLTSLGLTPPITAAVRAIVEPSDGGSGCVWEAGFHHGDGCRRRRRAHHSREARQRHQSHRRAATGAHTVAVVAAPAASTRS